MFSIIIRLDPTTAALLERLVNVLEGSQQSQVDALTTRVSGITQRLKTSQTALQAKIDQQ